MLLAVTLAVGAFSLLVAYGFVLLIFRHAFGVELPNPFDWLPLGGDRNSASLDTWPGYTSPASLAGAIGWNGRSNFGLTIWRRPQAVIPFSAWANALRRHPPGRRR
jgi:hypothetical protein